MKYIVVLIVWMVLGAIIVSSIDDKKASLRKWASDFPLGGMAIFLLTWPVWVYAMLWMLTEEFRNEKGGRE